LRKLRKIRNKKIFPILSYNLHKTKIEVFLYNKIREERVDTIKKSHTLHNLTLPGSGFSVSED